MRYPFAVRLLLLCGLAVASQAQAADTFQISPLPLAQNAKSKPDEKPEQQEARRLREINVRMNVLIGSHDYDAIEKTTADWLAQYRAKKMSADDYFNSLGSIAPNKAGKGMVGELLAWTRARPNSYVAWYTLGVQYMDIAWEERGCQCAAATTAAQFAGMARYAALSREAFLHSLKLGTDRAPSYSQLIRLAAITRHAGYSEPTVMAMLRQVFAPALQPARFCPARGVAGGEFPTAFEEELFYLCMSQAHDPEATLPFEHFVVFNSRRWSGTYQVVDAVLAEIERTRHASPKTVGEMRAIVLHQKGDDATDLDNSPDKGSRLYVQAFDAAPAPDHVDWLYRAANTENSAVKDKAFARALFQKIIAYRPGEAEAIAGIGWLDEEQGNLKGYMSGMMVAGNLGMFEAQNNLGYYYMVGQRGLPRDLHQARAWLTLAANQGFEHAREKLAVVDAMIAQEAKK
ncbi:MAG TPA: DUF4034 domain-containing protein [Burkholderiales bacterium]